MTELEQPIPNELKQPLSTDLEARMLWSVESPNEGEFAASMADIGDINLDGIADLAVGCPVNRFLKTSPPPGLVVVLSGRDGSELRRNVQPRERSELLYGYALQQLGDLNSDGKRETGFLDVFYDGYSCGRLRVLGHENVKQFFEVEHECIDAFANLEDLDGDSIEDLALVVSRNWIEVRSGTDGDLIYEVQLNRSQAVDSRCWGSLRFRDQFASISDVDADGFSELAVVNSAPEGGGAFISVLSGADGEELRRLRVGQVSDDLADIRFEPLSRNSQELVVWTLSENETVGSLHVLSTASGDARLLEASERLAPARWMRVLDDYDGDGLGEIALVLGAKATSCEIVSSRDGRTLTNIEAPQPTREFVTCRFTGQLAKLGDVDGDGYGEIGAQMASGMILDDGWMEDEPKYSLAVFSLRSAQ